MSGHVCDIVSGHCYSNDTGRMMVHPYHTQCYAYHTHKLLVAGFAISFAIGTAVGVVMGHHVIPVPLKVSPALYPVLFW